MLTLLKYELKKIFCNKFVVISLIAAVLISMAFPLVSFFRVRQGRYVTEAPFYEYQKSIPEYTVTPDKIKEMKSEIEKIEADDNNYAFDTEFPIEGGSWYPGRFEIDPFDIEGYSEEYQTDLSYMLSEEDRAIKEKYPAVHLKDEVIPKYVYYKNTVLKNESLLEIVKDGKEAEKHLNDKPWYTQEDFDLHRDAGWYKALNGQLEKGYREGYALGWDLWQSSMDEGNFPGIIVMILVIIGISGIFTNEYSAGIDSLILSSKRGRKKRFSLVKISAALIYIAACVALVTLPSALVSFALAGVRGADVSVITSNFGCGFYAITMYQACLLKIALIFAGALAVGVTTLLISSVTTNSAVSLFASLIIALFPFVFEMAYIEFPPFNQFIDILPLNIAGADALRPFEMFYLNEWVDIKYMFPAVVIITAVICIPAAVHVFRKRQVGK